jgi:alanyl-tRNA synthetase
MKNPNPKVDSALHVLKGAVQKVLNATLTTSVYAEGNKGRLSVEYEGKPTEQQIQEIEDLANKKIQENVPIEMFEMDRKEAESKYGNIIYDKFPVPAHVQKLTITQIQDWNINCCLGPHVATTGEIGKIKILKCRSRPNRKELEISFELV